MSVNLPVSRDRRGPQRRVPRHLRQQARLRRNIQLWRWSILVCLILLWGAGDPGGLAGSLHYLLPSPAWAPPGAHGQERRPGLPHRRHPAHETLVGFVLGSVFGILVAIALWWFPTRRSHGPST